MMVSGDGMSPHQILHTEIFESLVIWEVGNSLLRDTLRGGIWFTAIIPRPVPPIGLTSPDVGVGIMVMRVKDMRRIPSRDVVEVAGILVREVGRHDMMLVSDSGYDGIVPQTTIPYITHPADQNVISLCQQTLQPTEFGLSILVRS